MSNQPAIVIRSTANPTVRRLVKLRDNRARRKANRLLVDGWRETSQAIKAGLEVIGIYVADVEGTPPSGDTNAESLLRQAQQSGRLFQVSAEIMERISYGQSSRGIVAELIPPERDLNKIQLPRHPLVLVLDQAEKPGNVGAVLRCADAAGVDAVLLSDCSVDLDNPNVIRNSQGAVFRVASAAASAAEIADFLTHQHIPASASRVEASKPLWQCDLVGPQAIIFGSEAKGLGDRWKSLHGKPVAGIHIPMTGTVDSLNLAVSVAIVAFEASRQRAKASN